MQSANWVALMGRIPPEQHDNLILVTSNGGELAIQGVLRIEEEYLVLRARTAGTDLSRTIFVPYSNIAYIGFQKAVKEAQIREMYGEVEPAAPEPTAEPEAAGTPAPDAAAPGASPLGDAPAAGDAAGTNGAAPAAQAPTPDKRTMLERLRSRSFAGTLKSPRSR
jgi:hypothetical protein